MTAIVLPFPRSRDRAFISRHADHMANAATTAKAEAHLQRQLQIQRGTLERRGVTLEMIQAELIAIEGNIRAGYCRSSAVPGGVA
ncbi:DUF6074 family protein [Methylobacterium sp. E-041]|uniref:DUF6074 family protein n=1 Tax=Methylobacterium sp. E-041 TaxID=2836573 RepID=UPI001FBAB046|nr:DUF6074 family protein [Methylobacterium sp. E-041]MCJ2106990.1 DUF6074 family protein [Methylobacterium sp. E-041]